MNSSIIRNRLLIIGSPAELLASGNSDMSLTHILARTFLKTISASGVFSSSLNDAANAANIFSWFGISGENKTSSVLESTKGLIYRRANNPSRESTRKYGSKMCNSWMGVPFSRCGRVIWITPEFSRPPEPAGKHICQQECYTPIRRSLYKRAQPVDANAMAYTAVGTSPTRRV